ncbi:MAG TPA: T9SS type A sorting domain-containing protein, partial [Adhaeribacter sp.]|nr:T9SS type A sorting domain-containing protein [Adhaeribacter sp.]
VADSISETLTLASNIPGKASLSIPVYANKTKVSGPLSAGKEVEQARFNLYPNPVTDELVVARGNFFGKGTYTLEVLDAMGKTVKSAEAKTDITSLAVAELQRGVYFLRISAGGEVFVKKFIKL